MIIQHNFELITKPYLFITLASFMQARLLQKSYKHVLWFYVASILLLEEIDPSSITPGISRRFIICREDNFTSLQNIPHHYKVDTNYKFCTMFGTLLLFLNI
jgi:hypothetical protein